MIETFNAGILELSENERGITLRSYLSEKLGCDPMRITKKYTGASCLGKKVYHADNFRGFNRAEIDNATFELRILEQRFRSKLDEINRKKSGTVSPYDQQKGISTPAIDALLKHVAQNDSRALVGEKRKAAEYASAAQTNMDTYLELQQSWSQPLMNNRSAPPHSLIDSQMAGHGRIPSTQYQFPLHQPSPSPHSQVPFQLPNNKYDPSLAENYPSNVLPMLSNTAHSFSSCSQTTMSSPSPFSALLAGASILGQSNEMFTDSPHNNYSQDVHGMRSFNERLKNEYARPYFDVGNRNDLTDDTSHSKISLNDTDCTAAASSLIGFFNHVKRVSSHEDLVDYISTVQRSVDASCARHNADGDRRALKLDISDGSSSGRRKVARLMMGSGGSDSPDITNRDSSSSAMDRKHCLEQAGIRGDDERGEDSINVDDDDYNSHSCCIAALAPRDETDLCFSTGT